MPQPAAVRRLAPAGRFRARYRRIMRFAARAFVQAWWFELVLPRIGLARSRRARPRPRGCSGSRAASTCSPSTSAG